MAGCEVKSANMGIVGGDDGVVGAEGVGGNFDMVR